MEAAGQTHARELLGVSLSLDIATVTGIPGTEIYRSMMNVIAVLQGTADLANSVVMTLTGFPTLRGAEIRVQTLRKPLLLSAHCD